jgi:hypothetical protein
VPAVPSTVLPALLVVWLGVLLCAVLLGVSAPEGPQLVVLVLPEPSTLLVPPCPVVLPRLEPVVEEVEDEPQLELLLWFVEREVALTFPELEPEREFDASSDCISASLAPQ